VSDRVHRYKGMLSIRAGVLVAKGGDRVSDPLNDILVECCKLRGCYPLMHRTLHEFNWFCSCVIWGGWSVHRRRDRHG